MAVSYTHLDVYKRQELHVKGRNNYWKVRQAVETAKETLYSFDQLKTNKSEPRRQLRKMVFNVPTRRELTSGERAIQHGLARCV